MTSSAGPKSHDEVAAMIADVDAEGRAPTDPEWNAKYGENLSSYTHNLFGI